MKFSVFPEDARCLSMDPGLRYRTFPARVLAEPGGFHPDKSFLGSVAYLTELSQRFPPPSPSASLGCPVHMPMLVRCWAYDLLAYMTFFSAVVAFDW